MKLKKTILITVITSVTLISVVGFIIKNRIQTQVKELFKMNKELQEENYYMAEFEFKMLGISYYLGKGHYYQAFSKLNKLHHQMKTREGLIKMPQFNNKKEEFEFYLNLQNPKTGAFMDDSYPLNTQHEPTENVLMHLDALAEELGQPLKLKYPLKYLDQINTVEKLKAVLNDWSTVNWIALKFPQTSFHNVRDLLSLCAVEKLIQKHNLYNFSPEWKHTMLQWFYDNQDPETGVWGPRSTSGKLQKKDVSNSAPIIKAFLDEDGNNIYEEFPFRYGNEFFSTVLTVLDKPLPDDDELAEWHEWGLETPKGIKTLTTYLWKFASEENKKKARTIIEIYIKTLFEKFYIPKEGAFSYYPHGEHATIDGGRTGLKIYRLIGALSGKKQNQLWGSPEKNIFDIGDYKVSEITNKTLDLITKNDTVNSLRIYKSVPDYNKLTSDVSMVVYQNESRILDVMDLAYKTKKWIHTTNLTMGNWVSKEDIIEDTDLIQFDEVPVYEKNLPFEKMNKILQENGQLVIIGFDILQVPRKKIIFELKN